MPINPRAAVALLIIFLLWNFPDPPVSPIGSSHHRDGIIDRELEYLRALNTSNYGDLEPSNGRRLNITGLKKEEGFAWEALGQVKSRARQQSVYVLGDEDGEKVLQGAVGAGLPIYRNVSGHVRGGWVRSQVDSLIKRPHLNLTALLPADAHDFNRGWERNITGDSGNLQIEFSENGNSHTGTYDGIIMQDMKAEVTIKDKNSAGDGWKVVMYGTHFVDAGQIVLSTTSDKCVFRMLSWPAVVLTRH